MRRYICQNCSAINENYIGGKCVNCSGEVTTATPDHFHSTYQLEKDQHILYVDHCCTINVEFQNNPGKLNNGYQKAITEAIRNVAFLIAEYQNYQREG